jgi:hypothetical protein
VLAKERERKRERGEEERHTIIKPKDEKINNQPN